MSQVADATAGSGWSLTGPLRKLFCSMAPFILIAACWQVASLFFPPFLFPSLVSVLERVVEIFSSWTQFSSVLATALRILAGLAGAFLIAVALGLAIARVAVADRLLTPVQIGRAHV